MKLYQKELEALEIVINDKVYVSYSKSNISTGSRVGFYIMENYRIINVSKIFGKFIDAVPSEVDGYLHLQASCTCIDILDAIENYYETKYNKIISIDFNII